MKSRIKRITSTNRGTCTTGASSAESTIRYACTNARRSRNANTFTTTNAYTKANTIVVRQDTNILYNKDIITTISQET